MEPLHWNTLCKWLSVVWEAQESGPFEKSERSVFMALRHKTGDHLICGLLTEYTQQMFSNSNNIEMCETNYSALGKAAFKT